MNMKLQNDNKIFDIITKKEKMIELTEEISNMLNVSISEVDNPILDATLTHYIDKNNAWKVEYDNEGNPIIKENS